MRPKGFQIYDLFLGASFLLEIQSRQRKLGSADGVQVTAGVDDRGLLLADISQQASRVQAFTDNVGHPPLRGRLQIFKTLDSWIGHQSNKVWLQFLRQDDGQADLDEKSKETTRS